MDPLAVYFALFILLLLFLALLVARYFAVTETSNDVPYDSQTALNAIVEPMAILDADGRILGANVSFRSLFHEEPNGQEIDAIVEPVARVSTREPLQENGTDGAALNSATDEGTPGTDSDGSASDGGFDSESSEGSASAIETVLTDQSRQLTIATGAKTRHFDLRRYEGGGGRHDEQVNVLLFFDVTETHEYLIALERERTHFEEFASLISHDLRNPLDVAIGRTNALEGELDDPTHDEQLRETREALDRMMRIITDVLTLTREGESVENTIPVSLEELSEDAWRHVDSGEATLEISDSITFKADAPRALGIFENLYRNAIEHGGETVTITVGTLEDGDGFYIEDDGRGIPAEDREAVKDAGYSTQKDGTGLGLSIVSRIAAAHGWKFELTEGDSGGARFEFSDVEYADDPVRVGDSG